MKIGNLTKALLSVVPSNAIIFYKGKILMPIRNGNYSVIDELSSLEEMTRKSRMGMTQVVNKRNLDCKEIEAIMKMELLYAATA